MNEVVLILEDKKNEAIVYVVFDTRLTFYENFFIFNELENRFSFPLRIYCEGQSLDLNVPLKKMDLFDGQRLEVYSN